MSGNFAVVTRLHSRAPWFGYNGGAKALGSNRQGDDDNGCGDARRSGANLRAYSFYFLFFKKKIII